MVRKKTQLYFYSLVKCLLLSFVLLILPRISYSQDYNYHSYTIKSGLPSNLVYAIKQDKKGYIWATTDKGVVRYDGNKFKVFTVKDGLASNDNFAMLHDSKDNIWLYSFKAISKIEPSGKVKIFGDTKSYFGQFLINEKDKIIYTVLDSVSFLNNQRMYSVYLIDNDQIQKLEYRHIQIRENTVGYFYFLENKLYMVNYDYNSTKKIVFGALNENNNKFEKLNPTYLDTIPILESKSQIIDHLKLNDSITGVFFEHYYRVSINGTLKDQKIYPNNQKRITTGTTFIYDRFLLIVFDKSIYLFDYIDDQFHLFSDIDKCSGVIKDFEGNIWISTLGEGIIRFDHFSIATGILNNKFVSKQKIQKINGYKNKSLWVSNTKNKISNLFSNQKLFSSGLIDTRFIETDGRDVYFGGSTMFYKNNKKLLRLGFKAISLHGDSIAFTTNFGANFISKHKVFKTQDDYLGKKNNITGRMNAILMLPKIFYSGNQSGLYWGEQTKDELIPICLDDDVESISINGIKQSSDGLIWISTEGRGVYLLKNNLPIRHFQKELLDDNIHSMKIDEKDQIWLSTRAGVNKITFKNGTFECSKYTSFHGLPSNYVYDTYCYDDKLYVATDEGLIKLDLKQLDGIDFGLKPPIYVTDATYKDKGALISMKTDSTYSLNYNQNSISLAFTGISYKSNGNVSYQYRLLPSFKEWRSTSNQSIDFVGLEAGVYTFEVIAYNALGIKSKKPATYRFIIKKHFTNEIWFLALVAILMATTFFTIAYQVSKYRRNRILEKNETERLISELRLKSLQSQLNPHFIFNSLNAIQQFINTENKKSANDYLSRFARLMRLYLIGSDNQFITLTQELEVLKLYCGLEHLRFSNKFQYNISIDEHIDLEEYSVPAMLLQPHVENAIRHGLVTDNRENKLLKINVYRSNDDVVCEIIDNGIGRQKALAMKKESQISHRSMGNKISKDRLEMIRALKLAFITESIIDLTDEEGNSNGTKVVITISKHKMT